MILVSGMDKESFYEGFPMIFSQSAIISVCSSADKPCLGADFEQEFGTDRYVSYFFETFPFLFRKMRKKFCDPLGLSKRLRCSNPKSSENS